MKKLAVLLVFGLTVLGVGSASSEDAGSAPAGICKRVRMVNSTGLQGVQDLTPFLVVPQWANVSDTTSADTMLTSTAVWNQKPLYRVTPSRETRIDVDGPTHLTVISMVPFHRPNLGYEMYYSMAIRMDERKPETVWLKTTRANPLYTTGVPGWTFGLPEAIGVEVPGGRHSVYVKYVAGDFDFAYTCFQVNMTTDVITPPAAK
jgi:hypothetical protein